MIHYEQGGLANIAQNLAKQGRHGDTQLVHMSPGEVQGLQALAKAQGTSLTINPTTGLPEAFNFRWENLIPMAAGAALTIGSGGTLTPLMAAGLVGGGYGIATGSIEKGLMAGIGAYGGAGITEGLATAGANSMANATQTAATTSGTQAASTLAPEISTEASKQALVGESYAVPRNPALGYAGTETGVVNPSVLPQAATPTSPVTPTLSNVGRGIESLGTKEGLSAAYKGMPTGTLPATGISLLTAAQPRPPSVPGYQEDEYDRRLKGYRISPNYQPYQAPTPNPYYRPVYAAEGGVMGSFDDEPGKDMAHGGVASLGGYSDGGRMLRGPGDGMSDSIPGVIGGRQPARLADGEFVVPADVVSHLGNGSTEAGAKKLYGMMDKIRQARTGKKRQAPEIKADRYLPMKKMASGGITGYAEGGTSNDSGGVYEDRPFTDAQVASYLSTNNITSPSAISHVQSAFGISPDQMARAQSLIAKGDASIGQATSAYKEAIAAAPTQEAQNRVDFVTQLYTQQLGRAPDAEGLAYWTSQLASGKSPAAVASGINQALEGQQMDVQTAASAFRQALGRNPEPEGLQYWMSVAQSQGLSANQLKDAITKAAVTEQTQRGIAPGTKFTDMQLASLESDPYAGYFSNQSIYDIAPNAENVSMIDGRKVQFTTPVTRQAVVSNFVNGVYTATPGKDILNMPHIQASINVARANGTLDETDYNAITSGLRNAKTADEVRSVLAKPQANVVVDAIYGQQIGEAKTLAAAQAEAAQRNAVLTKQDPGYYQSNRALTDAYRAAGITVPFDYSAYQGVDTRDVTKNVLTPQNIAQKRTELVNELNRNNPYRVAYQPINRGIANLPASVQDPYSDAGLAFLYGNMMNQYAPAPLGQINPATFATVPFSYTPPPVNNLVLSRPIADAATTPPAPALGGTLGGAATAALAGDGG